MNICVISCDYGYEALYVEGIIYDQGYPLEGGSERLLYFLRLAIKLKLDDLSKIKFGYIPTSYLKDEELPDKFVELNYDKIYWENN